MNPGILLVLDGWGIAPAGRGNAIAAARTPNLDRLMATWPTHTLSAHGRAVGLPEGVVGNSEIGHLVIGAGRALDYDSLLVEQEVSSGRLRNHPALSEATGTLHVIGLASDGRIHSDIAHMIELCEAAKGKVAVHAITDGRDVAGGTAGGYLRRLPNVVDFIGRNYAMDKSGQEALTRRACDLILDGVADLHASDIDQALKEHEGTDDGWLPPTVITPTRVEDGDTILFANFRSDRTAPLADLIAERLAGRNVRLLSLAQYDTEHPIEALVPRADASGGLADALSAQRVRSVRIAEREKFEHVTFFLNGRDSTPRPLEESICVPSGPKGPRMNAAGIAQAILRSDTDLVIANIANIDVIGHTADYEATVAATEAVDEAVGVIDAGRGDRWMVIVGDHGNGEQMIQNDRPYGGHTTNPVPAVIAAPGATGGREGTLADIAPTVLSLLGCPVTPVMTGRSLL